MRHLVAALALGLVAALPTSGPDASIDEVLDQEMAASGVPGVAYAVVTDGEITSAGARGTTRTGSTVDVTTDTPFLSGSISKSFTAMAVMQLVEAGQVDLGAAISQYLGDFAGKPAGAVTVRQLLSHTSGFSTVQGNSSHTDAASGDDELAQRVDRIAELAPAHPPGERWEYSNTNYLVLGRLVEVLSGEDYAAYVASNILEPIGMTSSFVSDGEVHGSMATGHTPWFWTKRPLADNATSRGMAPAGGVVASAHDLALYLQTMMNGEDDVLSAESKAQMMRPAGGAATFYGLGWFVDSGNGTVWHSGSTPGVETLATMLPAQGRAVVVLVNGGSGIGFGETVQLRNAVTARALGLEYDGEGSRTAQKALFVGLALLPAFYLLSMVWAWTHRTAIRAKSSAGFAGLFSLWFPLLTTLVAGWFLLFFVPTLFGAPLATIRVFEPDMGLVLTASAVTGVAWAVFRLGVAYTRRGTDPALDDQAGVTEAANA